MVPGPFEPFARDLAPGERAMTVGAWSSLSLETIREGSGESFEEAWGRLWREFGERGEMESRQVLARRLARDPRRPTAAGLGLLYELFAVRAEGRLVAVRDHTAIVVPRRSAAAGPLAVVHLSHIVIEEEWRGRGLAAPLRALPVDAARKALAAAGVPDTDAVPVTLVAEMETGDDREAARRRLSYLRAGFRMVDPRVGYLQPDFRAEDAIRQAGPRPVPLALVIRRIGREQEESIDGAELHGLVDAVHAMFAVDVCEQAMRPVREAAARMPGRGEKVALLGLDAAAEIPRSAVAVDAAAAASKQVR
ncbi:MAG TPA: hypothetical protein VGK20_02280 [Candidatus Binatia bacterium]|jgi:hypothetical protein